MRVVSRMRSRALRPRAPRAIVAALVILAGCALAGCGQRGALYLPTVPPLPAKPTDETLAPSPDAAKTTAQAPEGTIPDTSGTPLSLSPETELHTAPDAAASAPQLPASSSTPDQ
ncbi:MAG: lipoprotein [Paraburkholderia sp.]